MSAQANTYTSLKVGCIPPSVNHYVKHARNGGHYIDPRAVGFASLLAFECMKAEPVYGDEFEVEIHVSMGKGQKGDVDNFPKLVLDTIARRGLLRHRGTGRQMSDSHITKLTVSKFRGEESQTTVEIIGVFEALSGPPARSEAGLSKSGARSPGECMLRADLRGFTGQSRSESGCYVTERR